MWPNDQGNMQCGGQACYAGWARYAYLEERMRRQVEIGRCLSCSWNRKSQMAAPLLAIGRAPK